MAVNEVMDLGDRKEPESMEMDDLIEHLKPYHLTVKYLKTLNAGDTLDVAIFDRNMEDGKIWSSLQPKELYDVVDFFSDTRRKVTFSGDHSWDILFNFGNKRESIEHELHIDMTDLYHDDIEHDSAGCVWHPVDCDGRIGNVYWKDLPDNTRVGWRGPAMLWKDLKEQGSKYSVYYLDPQEKENRDTCTIL